MDRHKQLHIKYKFKPNWFLIFILPESFPKLFESRFR